MPVFAYKAIDAKRRATEGTVMAETPRQARDQLRDKGLGVAHVRVVPQSGGRNASHGRSLRAQTQVIAFSRELGTLLAAGIPLLQALQALTKQHRGRFRTALMELADHVAAGLSLAEAMRAQGDYFDLTMVSIVEVGESTGNLDTALRRLASFKEKTHRLRSKVVTALVYPACVCIVGVAVCVFLMTYVVPGLIDTLTQAGRQLPAVTRVVRAASQLLLDWWWALALLAAGAVVLVRLALRLPRGRYLADRLILATPVVGQLARKEITSRIAVVLSALLRAGLQFVAAVGITRATVRNSVFRKALHEYEAAVASGKDVAACLESSSVFSPMVVQMLAVGQEAGNLEDMLDQLAEAYDHDVAIATARLTAMLEPLLIVILAILVGFIAFATILPILEISNVL